MRDSTLGVGHDPRQGRIGQERSRSVKKEASRRCMVRPAHQAGTTGSGRREANHAAERRGAVAGEQDDPVKPRRVGRAVREQHLVAVGLVAGTCCCSCGPPAGPSHRRMARWPGRPQQPQVVGQRNRGTVSDGSPRGPRCRAPRRPSPEVEHRDEGGQQHQRHQRPGDLRRVPFHEPDDQEGADADRHEYRLAWGTDWTRR